MEKREIRFSSFIVFTHGGSYLDVHRSTDGGTQVGWAEGEETKAVMVREWKALLDVIDSVDETRVNLSQVAALLHGNDAQMIFLIAPDQEGLGIVVVDTTSAWPVTASVGGLQETITLLEQEMVIDQLLLNRLLHASQWIEFALQFTLQTAEG